MNLSVSTAFLGIVALLAPILQDGAKKEEKNYFKSFLGKEPPEIPLAADAWLNSHKAITLKELRGKVVWLEFSADG